MTPLDMTGNGDGGGGPMPGPPLMLTGSDLDTTFIITNDITGDSPERVLNSVINGLGGDNSVQFLAEGVVASISFSDTPPTNGAMHLQNIGGIEIIGGTVTGDIDASDASAEVRIELVRGRVGGFVIGSDQNDRFFIGPDITIDGGMIDGGDGMDTLSPSTGFFPAAANLFDNVLTLITSGGSSSLTFTVANIETFTIRTVAGFTRLEPLTFTAATAGDNIFMIASRITGGSAERVLNSLINGEGGTDEFQLDTGGVVESISFSSNLPTGGDVHLQNIETITINDGMVTGAIDASAATAGVTVNLEGGTVGGNVIGGDREDAFNLYSAITINGYIDGQGGNDQLAYNGAGTHTTDSAGNTIPNTNNADGDNRREVYFRPRGGLAEDFDITDDTGDVRNFIFHNNSPVIGDSLSVRNIESLALSPALNLYGALSDALMQFGQQTAQGFALADLNPQTGRLTQLISKDSPFTKGRIWAHQITHSGNGKGSIGLALTGLTARAPNDYDYEMSLTQHGFDAPIVSSQWGAFGLRAVSHTMTGTIETNTAEAQVSGYGAGVSLLWRSRELRSLPRHHNLTAHITALAGGYEVDAHTSPSNPQAVVNEVSEGSFSAINAVISAGIADKRELANGLVMRTTADVSWQTLSLDDFTETGENGIIINFDKATRFTARIGTGLEGEHWFSDIAFVHETSSGGTLSSGLRQDYRQHDGTAIEMKFGGKVADLATGLTLKAYGVWRQPISGLSGDPSAKFELSYRF